MPKTTTFVGHINDKGIEMIQNKLTYFKSPLSLWE